MPLKTILNGKGHQCKAVMVAATKQHTGKTSVSMAMLSGLRKVFGPERVGYMKPVGQRHQMVEGGLKVSSRMMPSYASWDLSNFPRTRPHTIYGSSATTATIDEDDDDETM